MSFSADVNFNAEITDLTTSAEFVSIDLVMNLLTVFIESGVKIEKMNLFDLTTVVTKDFWSTTVITADLVIAFIEATAVEAEIISVVTQTGLCYFRINIIY